MDLSSWLKSRIQRQAFTATKHIPTSHGTVTSTIPSSMSKKQRKERIYALKWERHSIYKNIDIKQEQLNKLPLDKENTIEEQQLQDEMDQLEDRKSEIAEELNSLS